MLLVDCLISDWTDAASTDPSCARQLYAAILSYLYLSLRDMPLIMFRTRINMYINMYMCFLLEGIILFTTTLQIL